MKWLSLSMLCVVLGCGGLPPDVERVQRLFERGAYEDAMSAADDSLARHPRHAVLWRVKVQSAFGLRQAARAVAAYEAWYTHRGGHDRKLLERIALTTFWQGLRVPSASVQVRTIQAVERLEIEKLAQDVHALMDNDSDRVAAAASVALLRSRPGAPQIAGQLLSSEDPEARAIAVDGIARKLGRRARGNLAFSLRDSEPMVRRAGVRGFAAMKRSEDTAKLASMATDDDDADVRAEAVRALAVGKRPEALAVAREASEDVAPAVRVAAVAVLAARRAYDTLERMARAGQPMLSLHALAGMRGKRKTRAASGVRARVDGALGDESAEIRALAASALADALPRPEALAALRRMTGDADARVRIAAAVGLHELGERDAADLLSAACTDESVEAREAAVRAHQRHRLVTLGLVSLLADESALVRVQAAEALLHAVR